jgi:hypothetical protein
VIITEQPTVQSMFSGRPIHQRTISKKTKGCVCPKQKWPRQLQNHAFVELKIKKDCQVTEANTSIDRAVARSKAGVTCFRFELRKANNLVSHQQFTTNHICIKQKHKTFQSNFCTPLMYNSVWSYCMSNSITTRNYTVPSSESFLQQQA